MRFVSVEPMLSVSILTQLTGWVLRASLSLFIDALKFQSSPSSQAGCYLDADGFVTNYYMFQSSPSSQAGCYSNPLRLYLYVPSVSILTQLTGWVLRKGRQGRSRRQEFQSSPSSQAGCYQYGMGGTLDGYSFNPHPAHRLGATALEGKKSEVPTVSILTQLTGWVLL
mgnify:CR=1 FL=1